jgi:hypothetical protein
MIIRNKGAIVDSDVTDINLLAGLNGQYISPGVIAISLDAAFLGPKVMFGDVTATSGASGILATTNFGILAAGSYRYVGRFLLHAEGVGSPGGDGYLSIATNGVKRKDSKIVRYEQGVDSSAGVGVTYDFTADGTTNFTATASWVISSLGINTKWGQLESVLYRIG